MPRKIFIVLLVGFLIEACRGQKSEDPPIHLNPNMDTQRRLDPQEKADFFADGQSMRPIDTRTVAVGDLKEDSIYYQGKDSSGFVSKFPSTVKLNADFLKKGERRFATYCTPCHGPLGDGKGMVALRGYPPVTNLNEERVRVMPVGQIYSAITDGIRNMPSYSAQIDIEDRWAIVAYVRVLQRSQNAKIEDVPEHMRSRLNK